MSNFGDRNCQEDEGSRFLGDTRVGETFEAEYDSSNNLVTGKIKGLMGKQSNSIMEKVGERVIK